MAEYLLFPFYNREERRPRALWRLLLQLFGSTVFLLPGSAVAILLFARSQGLPFEGIPFLQPTPIAEQTVSETPWMNTAVLTLAGVAAVLSVWLSAKFLDRRSFADLGLHIDRAWWQDVGVGALIGALLASLVFIAEWAMGWVTVTEIFHNNIPGVPFALAFLLPLLLFVGISISEEVVVRGYMLTNTAEGLNFRFLSPRIALLLALIISALNFGLGHKSAGLSTLNITLAGVWLALAYILTGELALVFGIHFTWNLFQGSVFGFPVSGTVFDPTTIIAIEQAGPDLWTGGNYGPEAGLLGTAAFGLGIVLVLFWVRYRKGHLSFQTRLAEYEPGEEAGVQGAAWPEAAQAIEAGD